MESNEKKIEEKLSKIEIKMNKFSEILQNFGLDLIHSIGSIKHELGTLSKKYERIEGSIIEIKGIKTQLQETIKNQRKWVQSLDNINAKLKNLNQKYNQNSSIIQTKEEEYSKLNESPKDVLTQLQLNVVSSKSVNNLLEHLKKAKERIFILTGGHKILLELRIYEQKAMRDSNIHFDEFQSSILSKIKEWKTLF